MLRPEMFESKLIVQRTTDASVESVHFKSGEEIYAKEVYDQAGWSETVYMLKEISFDTEDLASGNVRDR